MLEIETWIKFVRGITTATNQGLLEWHRAPGVSSYGVGAIGRSLVRSMNSANVYTAQKGTGYYELSSADGFGRAPFELEVKEYKDHVVKPFDSVKSSPNVLDGETYELNQALESLYKVVAKVTESGDQTVSRFLTELGQED